MALSPTIEAMLRESIRRLHKEIDRRAEYAKGRRSRSTINRSVGQRYKRRTK